MWLHALPLIHHILWDQPQPRVLIQFLSWKHPKWDRSRSSRRMREAGFLCLLELVGWFYLWMLLCVEMLFPVDAVPCGNAVTCGGALLS